MRLGFAAFPAPPSSRRSRESAFVAQKPIRSQPMGTACSRKSHPESFSPAPPRVAGHRRWLLHTSPRHQNPTSIWLAGGPAQSETASGGLPCPTAGALLSASADARGSCGIFRRDDSCGRAREGDFGPSECLTSPRTAALATSPHGQAAGHEPRCWEPVRGLPSHPRVGSLQVSPE